MIPKTIRIVYLIGQLGLGGSERQLYLLLKYMDKDLFEPHVVVFNPSPNYTLDEDLRKAGVSVHPVPDECQGILVRIIWLFRLLRRLEPQVVHSWSIHDNPYAGLVGAVARVPLRLGSVRDALATPNFQQFSPFIRWLILHTVQRILVNSDEILHELNATGIPFQRITMLPNTVDIQRFRESGDLLEIPAHARIVGMIANLRHKKNHRMFIRGMAKILPDFPNLYGVMVGQPVPVSDPEIPNQVQTELLRLGVQNRILLSGFHANVTALLSRFEIFCLTSDFEGTPNVVLEAMAAGLPVIATRVGGIPNLVQHGLTGLLVARGDVDGLANALCTLLSNPDLTRQMGEAGRQQVKLEFSPKNIVPKFEFYYLSQLDR